MDIIKKSILIWPEIALYINNQKRKEYLSFALKVNPFLIRYIEDQSEDLCVTALLHDQNVIIYIKEITKKILKVLLLLDIKKIFLIDQISDELMIYLIKKNINTIRYIKNPSHEICILVIKENIHYINKINPKFITDELLIDIYYIFKDKSFIMSNIYNQNIRNQFNNLSLLQLNKLSKKNAKKKIEF